MNTCNTCGKTASNPWRSYSATGIVHGCVDDFHTEALKGMTIPTAVWHFSKSAKVVRAATKARRKEMFK